MFDEDDDDIMTSCCMDLPALSDSKRKTAVIRNQSSKKTNMWITPSFDGFECQRSNTSQPAAPKTSKRKVIREFKNTNMKEEVHDGKRMASIKSKHSYCDDLWVDKYKPHRELDLAVHKKKVAEVRNFLQNHFKNKHKQGSILLLTGPSGAGKTATLQVLAEEMSIEIQEWVNPITDVYSDNSNWQWKAHDFSGTVGGQRYESQMQLFQEFVVRANKYPSLQIFNQDHFYRKLVLVEDIPNIFFKNVELLHGILRDYSLHGHCPLVFILSDSAGGASNEFLLFPKEIQSELSISNICFNPVAPTSLTKVLTRIASEEFNMNGGQMKMPSKNLITSLASTSSGDIRGAINALQFACLKDTSDLVDLISSQPATKLKKSDSASKKSSRKSVSISEKAFLQEAGSGLAAVGARDTSLFLFRALGKILYCKRDCGSRDNTNLPAHLNHCYRNPLTFNPEDVIERSNLSGELFMLYLHQNYVDFYTNLDDIAMASDYFSEADQFTSDWANRSILQDYAASVAVRGVIFSKSANSVSLGWKPLNKPQIFEVNKKTRANKETGKYLFKGNSWTTLELYTNVVPYLKLINPQMKVVGQISFIQEISKFKEGKISRKSGIPLDEKDVAVEDEQQDVTTSGHICPKDDYIGPVDDDEVIIEEFSD